jgi:hypothetical protein
VKRRYRSPRLDAATVSALTWSYAGLSAFYYGVIERPFGELYYVVMDQWSSHYSEWRIDSAGISTYFPPRACGRGKVALQSDVSFFRVLQVDLVLVGGCGV